MRQYPLVNLPGLDTLEAEKGEVLVNAQKVTFAVGGKPHSRGGTDMLAEEGSYILSKHLKLDEAVVKALGYAEKRTSPADLSRKSSTQEYKDILDSVNNKRYDDLSKKTAALMFEKNAARQDLIFQAQEDFKASKGMKNNADYAKNGVQVWKDKYQDGGATDPNWGPWSNDMYGGLEALSQAGTYSGPGPLYENPITGKVVNTGVLPQNNPQPLRKNVFGNVPNRINLKAEDTLGYSTIEGNQYASYYRPFANDPYFDVQQDILKTGKMTTTQKKMLGDRQARLSKLKEQFPEPEGSIIEKEYGKYLR